jgi:hypothetical protein
MLVLFASIVCGITVGLYGAHPDGDTGVLGAAAITGAGADVFEVITADRPYRRPMSTEQVLQVLEGSAGSVLDLDVVSATIVLTGEHRQDLGLGMAGAD